MSHRSTTAAPGTGGGLPRSPRRESLFDCDHVFKKLDSVCENGHLLGFRCHFHHIISNTILWCNLSPRSFFSVQSLASLMVFQIRHLGPGGPSRHSLQRRLMGGCTASIDRCGENSGYWQTAPALGMWEQPAGRQKNSGVCLSNHFLSSPSELTCDSAVSATRRRQDVANGVQLWNPRDYSSVFLLEMVWTTPTINTVIDGYRVQHGFKKVF